MITSSNWKANKMKRTELFVLSDECIEAMDGRSALKTLTSMREAGVANTPYPVFDIRVSSYGYLHLIHYTPSKDEYLDMYKTHIDVRYHVMADCSFAGSPLKVDFLDTSTGLGIVRPIIYRLAYSEQDVNDIDGLGLAKLAINMLLTGLVTLLATRNVVKTKKTDSLARSMLGNKKHAYIYTTTLTIGKITENEDGSAFTGKSLRPHWRRGFPKTQHYGPGNKLTKDIFIQPVFVNGEGAYTPRDDYKVIKGK